MAIRSSVSRVWGQKMGAQNNTAKKILVPSYFISEFYAWAFICIFILYILLIFYTYCIYPYYGYDGMNLCGLKVTPLHEFAQQKVMDGAHG